MKISGGPRVVGKIYKFTNNRIGNDLLWMKGSTVYGVNHLLQSGYKFTEGVIEIFGRDDALQNEFTEGKVKKNIICDGPINPAVMRELNKGDHENLLLVSSETEKTFALVREIAITAEINTIVFAKRESHSDLNNNLINMQNKGFNFTNKLVEALRKDIFSRDVFIHIARNLKLEPDEPKNWAYWANHFSQEAKLKDPIVIDANKIFAFLSQVHESVDYSNVPDKTYSNAHKKYYEL